MSKAALSPRSSAPFGSAAVAVEKNGTSALIRFYLVLYNIACIIGWAYIDYLIIRHFFNGGEMSGVWSIVEMPLKVVQTAAALEILHALLGWVRSGVFTAFVQGA